MVQIINITHIINLSIKSDSVQKLSSLMIENYAVKHFNENNLSRHFWVNTAKQNPSTFVVYS